MPPFPGMDPFLEKPPIFHELHTQMLAEAQRQLQGQVRPRYVARLERHLSEGSVWGLEIGVGSLEGKEPDIAIVTDRTGGPPTTPTGATARPTATMLEDLAPEELDLRKQRRIVIYVNSRPRTAVTSIELLSPANKRAGSVARSRYLEKRASALHGGMHWVEIDLLRGGQRPPLPLHPPTAFDYLTYVARATPSGWEHILYSWKLRDAFPSLPIPLLADDRAVVDLGACFRVAYEACAADDEADYGADPPPPDIAASDRAWIEDVLRGARLRA